MATTSTQIDILLKARADLAALKSARGELGGMQREIKDANEALKGFAATGRNVLGALGVGFSAAGVVAGIKSVIDAGSKITDLAAQTGISTDAFQTLALSAKLAGVENEQFALVLSTLKKNIAEAANGTGPAVKAFQGLGLSARKLSEMPLERAMELVARAVFTAEDKTKAYALALDALGSKNVPRLMEALQKLAKDGYDNLADSMRKSILTPEQLKLLDEAGDKLTVAEAKWTIFKANVLGFFDEINKRREARGGIDFVGDPALNGWLALNDIVKVATRSTEDFDAAQKSATGTTEELWEIVREVALSEKDAAAFAELYADAQKFATQYISERQKILEEEHKRTLKLNEDAAKLGEEQRKFIFDQLPPLERHAVLQERLNELKREGVALIGRDDDEGFARRLKIEQAILQTDKEIAQVNSGLAGSLDSFFGNIDAASTSMVDFKEETKKTRDIADELGLSFSSAFEDAIVEGRKLSDVLKGLAQDILRIVVRKSITEPIGNYISSFFGGGKAAGGPVSGGTAYVVGERGPELFVPSMSGAIVPNHELMAAGAGGGGETYNFTQNFMGGVTRAEMADIIPQIVEASKSAVLDARRRRQPGFA